MSSIDYKKKKKFSSDKCVCVYPLTREGGHTPFFEFELKPSEKDSSDPTQHEFQHHIV